MEEGERILVEGITLRTTKYDLMRYFRKWGPLAESFVNIHEIQFAVLFIHSSTYL